MGVFQRWVVNAITETFSNPMAMLKMGQMKDGLCWWLNTGSFSHSLQDISAASPGSRHWDTLHIEGEWEQLKSQTWYMCYEY